MVTDPFVTIMKAIDLLPRKITLNTKTKKNFHIIEGIYLSFPIYSWTIIPKVLLEPKNSWKRYQFRHLLVKVCIIYSTPSSKNIWRQRKKWEERKQCFHLNWSGNQDYWFKFICPWKWWMHVWTKFSISSLSQNQRDLSMVNFKTK